MTAPDSYPCPDGVAAIVPPNREDWLEGRAKTIGASEVAALVGVHPWLTAYELFMTKTGRYERPRDEVRIAENSIHLPPTERGNLHESNAFELIQRLRPSWTIEPNTIPGGAVYVDQNTRLSSTPDAFIVAPDRPGRGVVQVKTVAPMAFANDWKDETGEIQFPTYVAVQAIVDASLSGCEWACAAAMVSNFGVDLYMIDIPLTPGLMARLRTAVAEFWRRVDADDPYPPDYARDGALIAGLYPEDDGGEVEISADDSLLRRLELREHYLAVEKAGRAAEEARATIDAELRWHLKNAVRGRLPDGRIVEAKTTRVKAKTIEPYSFRAVKVKETKQ